MARVIDTSDRDNLPSRGNEGYWVYNGLDCCITREIIEPISSLLDPQTRAIYDFEVSLQGPAMEMDGRGILVDRVWRDRMVAELRVKEKRLLHIIQRYSRAIWDAEINPDSPPQLHKLFYVHMKIPEIRVMKQGKWKVSTDREALEKMEIYFYARPMVLALLAYRDVSKQIKTLLTGIDSDSRFRTSYNIAGTTTGRWSSSENDRGTGGNLQNISGDLRRPMVADRGKKLGYFDLKTAESKGVGLLAWLATGKSTYLDACEAGDLHTVVSKLCWPNFDWTGDLKKDRELAEQQFYRMFSRRDLAKRGGHGSNYYGQPPTIAKNLKIEVAVADAFQRSYFKAFPEIPEWHADTAVRLRRDARLITPLGRVRHFFDRLNDDSTLRAAIAHVPQSLIADILNEALYQIWFNLGPKGVQVLLQVHDAVVVQYPEEREDELIPQILRYMRKPYYFRGREFIIGSDAEVGWNWAKYTDQSAVDKSKRPGKDGKVGKPKRLNLDGLREWKPGDGGRRRSEQPNQFRPESILEKVF